MDYTLRPMTDQERLYTYTQSSQIGSMTGNIGHLRADMDSGGEGFFSSWTDFRSDLKTNEFKEEFDELINNLREEDGPLQNRKTSPDSRSRNCAVRKKDLRSGASGLGKLQDQGLSENPESADSDMVPVYQGNDRAGKDVSR